MPPKTEFGRHSLGIGLYLAGVLFFAANDALAKWLVVDYDVMEMLLVRSIGGVAMLLPMAWFAGVSLRLGGSRWLHLVRIVLQTVDTYCFYRATRYMPLADVMTFYMAMPIIATALSALVLRERVGPYRWSAVVVGFVGVVIALAPSRDAFQWSALLALFGAVCFAVTLTMTRKMRDNHPLTLVTCQFIGSGVISGVVSPMVWTAPSLPHFGMMLVLGFVSAGCFLLITRALALAQASLLAPFQYSAILWAALFGWVIWHDAPTPRIVLGNLILIGSGLFVFYRERRLAVSVSDRVDQVP